MSKNPQESSRKLKNLKINSDDSNRMIIFKKKEIFKNLERTRKKKKKGSKTRISVVLKSNLKKINK